MYDAKLATFIQVVRAGSFSKAATQLFISAVSIMKQMNSLEEMVGVKLLNRSTQGVSLTKAGNFFYESVNKYMTEADRIVARTRDIAQRGPKTIKIGTSLLRSAQPLIKVWSGMADYTDYQIDLVSFEDDPLSMQRMFINLGTKIDFFVGPMNSEQIEHGPYQTYELSETKLYWGVPISNGLATKQRLTFDDLQSEKVILVKRGLSPRLDTLRDRLEAHHITVIDSDDFYDINTFNICSQNNYIMETLGIWQDAYAPIKAVAMDATYQMPYGIVYSQRATAAVQQFIELIGAEYRRQRPALTSG
ncbi:LysR family transcriptional regulator [Levilactobacillus suantsaii]|nr:LysR family transcriptional regulator [Levilactobacillus suantsaii]